MSDVFYNKKKGSSITLDSGSEESIGGVYCSEPRWNKGEITEIDPQAIVDTTYWKYEVGNIVALQVDGNIKKTPFRISDISDNIDEPQKIVLSHPTKSGSYVLDKENGQYIVQRHTDAGFPELVCGDPNALNTVKPIVDSWLMKAFGELGQMMAKDI